MELAEPLPRNESVILERGYERLLFWQLHSKSFAAANRPVRDRSVG